jgi:hypothetical protein
MLMLPKTTDKVQNKTDPKVNEAIRERTERNIRIYSSAAPEDIARRLEELDREWNIERTLETNAASFSLLGLALGTFVNRKWYALPAVVNGFLLQHSLQGWCPPLAIFRRLGIRTAAEIEDERSMLKANRGDFTPTGESTSGSSTG